VRCLVTGGAGYVGSWLIPRLLADGHQVTCYDIQWFGDGFLPKDNENLRMVKADIRDLPALKEALRGIEAVIHLACVSNDHSCQLDEALSTSINFDAFEPLVIAAKEAGVGRFIYCSSSSVYGVSEAADVREDHPLVPLTLYNRYKGMCEPLLFKHKDDDFVCVTIRPATVCGYAPRQRFDLTVNIITAHAALKGAITVFGGKQRRPNLHIKDMAECYRMLLTAPAEKIQGETFNVGSANMAVGAIAEKVRVLVENQLGIEATIETTESTDIRSYHVNSDKIRDVLGFVPRFTVQDAIIDLCARFKAGMWKDGLTNPIFTNVKQLVDRGFAVQDSLASYRKDRYADGAGKRGL
jgi:nucleoside-diphosphate-sugar epimerase